MNDITAWVEAVRKKAAATDPTHKWREENRERYNELQREAYARRMEDPEYRKKMAKKKREYYLRKKAEANG